MIIQYRASLLALSMAISLAAPLSAASVIGIASTFGTMDVNSASVRSTANILDGALVETNATPGQIRLESGVQVNLSENTSATVYADHLQLKRGAIVFTGHQNYWVDALCYRVEGKDNSVSVRIAHDQNRILVTAAQSAGKVSRDDKLLTQLNPGETYFFNTDGQACPLPATFAGKPHKVVKAGLSIDAKWGVVAGTAAAATGVGVYLAERRASR
jgi:hypothetical protein